MTPDWILFVRSGHGSDRAILYDRATQTFEQLGSVNWNRAGTAFINAIKVNGQFAVWTRCTGRFACQVKRRDLTAGQTVSVPGKVGKVDYASSVGSDGTVFYARSGPDCGASVRFEVTHSAPSTRCWSSSSQAST